jgi:hypothetical protein
VQIDVWYPRLKAFTFDTVFLPLTCGEGAAMVHAYDDAWRHRPGRETSALDVRLLQRLEARIAQALDRSPFWDEETGTRVPAFLRLCGRSPKDGEPHDRGAVWSSYLQNLDGVRAELSQYQLRPQSALAAVETFGKEALTDEGNAMLIAISRTPTLCITSAPKAISLHSSSEHKLLYYAAVPLHRRCIAAIRPVYNLLCRCARSDVTAAVE